jgi:ribosomal protein S18 acetylase RimI-like enzyme
VGGNLLIRYDDTKKDLPPEQLHHLFIEVGWSDGLETPAMLENFNQPFINSTLVISAWNNQRLVGAIRVLSDKIIRSVIFDLVVDPEFQRKGIGKELINRCIKYFPHTEWLVQTTAEITGYYESVGFKKHNGVFLSIPSKWFETK